MPNAYVIYVNNICKIIQIIHLSHEYVKIELNNFTKKIFSLVDDDEK